MVFLSGVSGAFAAFVRIIEMFVLNGIEMILEKKTLIERSVCSLLGQSLFLHRKWRRMKNLRNIIGMFLVLLKRTCKEQPIFERNNLKFFVKKKEYKELKEPY